VNAKGKQERDAALSELDAVVRELESVAGDLKSARGIGVSLCVASLENAAHKYRKVRAQVAQMD
jgi:chaperonin cofactor prefoldin